MAAAKRAHSHSKRAQAKRLRAKRRGQAKRTQQAGRLAVAVGLGFAVATGHGVATAATDDGQSTGPASDTESGANANDPGTTTETEAEAPTTTEGSQTTTTPSGDAPTTSTSSSGGALTSSEYEEEEEEESEEAEAESEGDAGSTGEEPAAGEDAENPSVTTDPGAGLPEVIEETTQDVAGTDELSTLSAAVEASGEEPTEEEVTVPVAARSMAATSTTTAVPAVSLPPYPTVPGATPTQVAVAVVAVLFRALQTAVSGPVPNPVAIPLYFILVAAYQRLTEIALNHVPVANPSTPLVVPVTNTITGFLNASDPDGDPLSWSVTGDPAKGSVILDPVLGSYVYTPKLSFIRDGGTDTFTVTIDDSAGAAEHFYAPNGHITTQEITVALPGTGINIPPVAVGDSGPRDAIGVIRGGIDVVDADDDTHTFSLANGNTAGATATSSYTSLGGIVSLDTATGDWTYVPAVSGNLLGIPLNTDSFVVTTTDGFGTSVQTTVLVGADLQIAPTGTSTNPSNGAYSGGLNIPEDDEGLLTYSGGTVDPAKGTLTVDANGNFTYTPTAAARHAAAADNATSAQKVHTFDIYGTDANNRTIKVATVDVTISATNASPSATYTLNPADANGVVTGTISVTDGDLADDHTFGPSSILTGKGTVSVNTDTGAFTFTPTAIARHAASAVGAGTADTQVSFSINVNDGYGGTTSVTVTAPISPKNTAPSVSYARVAVGGIVTYTPIATDADLDLVTHTITTQPTKGTVLVNLGGAIVYTANNLLFPASDSFVVTASDGHGGVVVTTLNPF